MVAAVKMMSIFRTKEFVETELGEKLVQKMMEIATWKIIKIPDF